MSSSPSGSETSNSVPDFGANDWLVADMYAKFREDRNSVDEAWWPTLERYGASLAAPAAAPAAPAPATPAPAQAPVKAAAPAAPAAAPAAPAAKAAPAAPAASTGSSSGKAAAKTTARPARNQPVPAEAPKGVSDAEPERAPEVEPLKGIAKAIAKNMDVSLEIPTATSYREVPAKLMIDNRIVINNHLRRTRGGKVSFTHLLGYALVQALKMFPSQNVYYDIIDGKPSVVTPAHVNLGIAIDVENRDGSRGLVVPSIKQAERMNFREFVEAYEELIKRGRTGALTPADHAGATISLTNPGGIGTVQSSPRLTKGQGCIIGAGALDYPAAFQGAAQETMNDLAISKRITISSTYDHRVIQGAGSGEFLKIVSELLMGGHEFYENVFADLRIPYRPIKWSKDVYVDTAAAVNKTARVQQVINMYRVRGHMMADIDPLEYVQRTHPDLEIETHGLTFWDLEREFVTAGFSTKRTMKLRDILGILRDTYCRTIGIEYMHIQDPEQRGWFQAELEHPYIAPTHDEQLRILTKLNEAEAFETFLQTKYVGQKRFSLEGSESVIALLDQIAMEAIEAKLSEVAIGMAHRGRLNVLANIAGKTYNQVFREFEGATANRVTGTGDVKYHVGIEGVYTSPEGDEMPIYLAANPSHLEAVNGVLEGIVRGKQDRHGQGDTSVLPVLIHGDAAMAGQGIVYETLQMSQLRAYRTGGTIHVIINNQVGFTTSAQDARTSMYCSDVAKSISAPVFHVNGDDPEAVAHVAQLAFKYREKFNRDVVIDLVSYRRRGHNEGDDPSMTQPLMYDLIEAKRSVRKIYAENLVGRGDITREEFDKAQADFHGELEKAFAETHEVHTESISAAELSAVGAREEQNASVPSSTAIPQKVVELIGEAHEEIPEGFTVHPKLQRVLDARYKMSREGGIDWAFGELLGLGSLLVEGTPVRMSGQDSRRGTFTQRHALLHDRKTDQNWIPLQNLSDDQARFSIYDSFLSEYAVMGFEYGYSVERPDALVLWEAQFGDFANGAQTIIDEFIAAGEQKWAQRSSVVLLLPHGYEGQGPDHSSGRIERFLTLCAQDNMTVAQPSTPANYAHLLRRQAYQRPRKPLVVFTPKSMLRLRGATSSVEDFTTGHFEPVIDDARISDRQAVRRVVIHSGKLHYELKQNLEKTEDRSVALVRLEQYYPMPVAELREALDRYPNADVVWAQEEPANQGAWPFIQTDLAPQLDRPITAVTRPAASAPSVGTMKAHQAQQATLVATALGQQ
ncbi:multifunctional oxoglutarate decarboxylase/oxoglutarate dehydrogenase thiamine pyrophosphate-binding subunit/dihydrolipoyllysine-residue succinyltransferase subunit [Gulosibacter macacae]|uniref:Multifunctional oxoglutarate decarboxylase/oxoglutarate dehydrogenase thiamine pyrophosphate-binding subunit/dihydrolipoyllysine-residue succinyltransferase subunit n=1 Tax=Gulosibacter macacae TaxID=2488791 RepID=A0A3P3W127_9MICO|nr:multifunctional oxoglutarate decarboxylase/oxoglutarate dehydrogenase thiamine pyrophosphate-binding subunit/dihydrolipoyllysine-residue succinyltransferase subunit [Gulosibacter macacae]RRJ88670.1 multifunctional oxoglutarate decarboxylase/oxoglutarate dehydrogenase thiamine pyrophosphate-binding subunit/dihydrolipoyllysine-residue succinyltransferase subunit [Gulosibacter macacae]